MGIGHVLPDKNIAAMIDHTILKPEATPRRSLNYVKKLKNINSHQFVLIHLLSPYVMNH